MLLTRKIVPLFFLLTLLMACQGSKVEDVTPEPKRIFTFHIDSSYPTADFDNVIFIHDENGQLIDYKVFENGQVIVFETTKDIPKKLNITIFNYITRNGFTSHNFHTYSSIESGQEWTLKGEKLSNNRGQTEAGDFNIIVSDVPQGYASSLTDKNGFHCRATLDHPLKLYSANPPLQSNQQKYFLYIADRLGNPKYKLFENIKKNDTYNFSFRDMENFDHLVEVSFPKSTKISLITKGWEENQPSTETGYYVNLYLDYSIYNNELTSIKAGYLNRFTKYLTELSVEYDNLSYFYIKRGSKPDHITLPTNATFTLQNRSLNNFSFNQNQPFVRRSSSWAYKEESNDKSTFTYWNAYAPQGIQKTVQLPPQFTAQYPLLQLEKLKHTSTIFYTQAQSYIDFTEEQFKEKLSKDDTEIYAVNVK